MSHQATQNGSSLPGSVFPTAKLPVDRPIPSELRRIEQGQIAKRIEMLRGNQTLSPEEIYLMLNPTETNLAIGEYTARKADFCEVIRNVVVLLPLIITWLSLGTAVDAFSQSVTSHQSQGVQDFTLQSFLYLWAQGFPGVRSISLLGLNLLKFGDFVGVDIFLISMIVVLTTLYHILESFAKRRATRLRVWLQQELDTLAARSSVRSLGPGSENKSPLWAVQVHTAINQLHSVLGKVETSVLASEKSFAETIDRFTATYQRQDQNIDKLLDSMSNVDRAIDQLNIIYQQGKDTYTSLDAILPRLESHFSQVARFQEESNKAQQTTADQFTKAVAAIDMLARPFVNADLATIADSTIRTVQQITHHQQAVLEQVVQLENHLAQARLLQQQQVSSAFVAPAPQKRSLIERVKKKIGFRKER